MVPGLQSGDTTEAAAPPAELGTIKGVSEEHVVDTSKTDSAQKKGEFERTRRNLQQFLVLPLQMFLHVLTCQNMLAAIAIVHLLDVLDS